MTNKKSNPKGAGRHNNPYRTRVFYKRIRTYWYEEIKKLVEKRIKELENE